MVNINIEKFQYILKGLSDKNGFEILELLVKKDKVQRKTFLEYDIDSMSIGRVIGWFEKAHFIKKIKIESGKERGSYYLFEKEEYRIIAKSILEAKNKYVKIIQTNKN